MKRKKMKFNKRTITCYIMHCLYSKSVNHFAHCNTDTLQKASAKIMVFIPHPPCLMVPTNAISPSPVGHRCWIKIIIIKMMKRCCDASFWGISTLMILALLAKSSALCLCICFNFLNLSTPSPPLYHYVHNYANSSPLRENPLTKN